MIDIHTHILYGLDDGADSLEQTIELAQQAAANGILQVIATPHHRARGYDTNAYDIKQLVLSVNQELQKRQINVKILPGQEVRVYDELLADWERGMLTSLADSNYILIEFPSSSVPKQAEELFHELQLMGLTPIIAHPERNRELAGNLSLLAHFSEMGVLAQLTSSSISGNMGKKLQKLSIEMCKKGLVQFIASDAHHVTNRPFDLAEGYQAVQKHLGDSYVEYYQLNATQLVKNLTISQQVPQAKRRFIFW